jgi:hypothetical protein
LTVKLHEPILPPETGHVKLVGPVQSKLVPLGVVGGPPPALSITNVSEVPQPDPVTVTTVPVGAIFGVNVTVATETVKVCVSGPCST